MMEILIPILAVTVIGLICAVGLAVASSVMAVKEDTRFTEIRECLPGANCGACGYTGCDGYAKALLEPGTKTNLCVPGADAVAAQIAALLGVAAEDVVEKIAVVQCAGTCEATSVKADYRGIPSCAAAKLFYGGNGSCIFGCMGFGDCVKACPQGAISMQDGIACVNHTACIGCGICAQTCPQKIIEIVPDIIRTEVLCSSYHNGPYTKRSAPPAASAAISAKRPVRRARSPSIISSPASTGTSAPPAARAPASARPAQWSTAISPARPESSRSKRPAAHPENKSSAAARIPAAAFVYQNPPRFCCKRFQAHAESCYSGWRSVKLLRSAQSRPSRCMRESSADMALRLTDRKSANCCRSKGIRKLALPARRACADR